GGRGGGGEAGVEQAHGGEARSGGGVGAQGVRLLQHRLFPAEPEPGEVLEDTGDEARARAANVDVLDAHKEAAADGTCPLEGEEGGKGMAQMQFAIRTGGKPEDRSWHRV